MHGQLKIKNKAKNTHPEYVILIPFPCEEWLHEGAAM
jgi:hypothetical protein